MTPATDEIEGEIHMEMTAGQIKRIVERVDADLPVLQGAIKFCKEAGFSVSGILQNASLYFAYDKDVEKAKAALLEAKDAAKVWAARPFAGAPPEHLFYNQYNHEGDTLYSEFAGGIHILCSALNLEYPLKPIASGYGREEEALLKCKSIMRAARSLLVEDASKGTS